MKHLVILALAVLVLATVARRQAEAVPFDARTNLVSAAAPGNSGFIRNVLGTADITKTGSFFFGPGTTHVGTASASTVGFFDPFVIGPTLLSNLGKAAVEAGVENIDGGFLQQGAGGGRLHVLRRGVRPAGESPGGHRMARGRRKHGRSRRKFRAHPRDQHSEPGGWRRHQIRRANSVRQCE